MTTSCKFCGSPTTTNTALRAKSASSRSEIVPRLGMKGRPELCSRGMRAVDMGAVFAGSVVHTDHRRPLLPQQSIGAEDHDQQEQNEEEHLPVSGGYVVAAQRLH